VEIVEETSIRVEEEVIMIGQKAFMGVEEEVPRRIFSHGYTGRFARSLVRRIPAVSTRNRAYAAGADTERRQSGFAISVGVSAGGVVHSTRNQGTLSSWGPASCEDRPTACGSAN